MLSWIRRRKLAQLDASIAMKQGILDATVHLFKVCGSISGAAAYDLRHLPGEIAALKVERAAVVAKLEKANA